LRLRKPAGSPMLLRERQRPAAARGERAQRPKYSRARPDKGFQVSDRDDLTR